MGATPTPNEASILAAIKARESSGRYDVQITPYDCVHTFGQTKCTASGAYGFIDATWRATAQATGVGTEYASAYLAPAWVQDYNALALLRSQGTAPWGGSAALPADGPLVDLAGADATTPTATILDGLVNWAGGVDLSPEGDIPNVLLAAGLMAALYLVATR